MVIVTKNKAEKGEPAKAEKKATKKTDEKKSDK